MAMIEYKQEEGIAYITLNRPEKLNALTDDMAVELCDALYQFNDDPSAHAGIISGNGRAFCSGADVKQRHLKPREEVARLGRNAGRKGNLMAPIFRVPHSKPLIAAVHGYVLGGGFKLALYCDLIVAAKDAKFQITEMSRGLDATPFWIMLTQRGASAFATEVALTGRMWSGTEGAQNGIVNRVCEPGEQLREAENLAREILKNPPLAVRAVIEVRRAITEQVEAIGYAMRPRNLHLSEDFRESALAFVEKRTPVFRGR